MTGFEGGEIDSSEFLLLGDEDEENEKSFFHPPIKVISNEIEVMCGNISFV